MGDRGHQDRDWSFALAHRANELMRDYGPSATPKAYTVWYVYVSGTQPHMNDAIKRLTAQNGQLSDADIEALYDAHIDGRRLSIAAERMSASMLTEIEGITEMLDLSLGSTTQYGESLRAFTDDLVGATMNRARIREIVAGLVATTREVAANNRILEARMRESRTEIEALRETLEASRLESLTDPLTGLSNRKHFEDILKRTVAHAAASGEPLGLIVLDIDFFKRFNDLYGHLTGDQVLRLVGIVMREQVAGPSTLSRFGGEEFGVVLPGKDRATTLAVAERIRVAVMGRELVKRSTGESLGQVTISLGIAAYRRGDTPISLLERADLQMFAAKRKGRNCCLDDSVEIEDATKVA